MRRNRRNIGHALGTYDVKDTFVDGIYEERSSGCAAPTTITKHYAALAA